jgi:hypothetical protein
VREAAECGALHRRAGRIVRVDLDDPAEAKRLGRRLRQVEARIDDFPAVQRMHAPHAEAAVRVDDERIDVRARLQVDEITEIILDVLFGREVRAPRRLARGAVRQRAERAHAVRIVLRAQERRAARGAAEVDRRLRRDAAVVARVLEHPPAAALAHDLDHRDALRRLRDVHDLRVPAHELAPGSARRAGEAGMTGEHQRVVGVLVVDAQNAAIATRAQREEVDRIAVLAEATLLELRGARLEQAPRRQLRSIEVRRVGPQARAPAHDHVVRIARRQHHLVGRAALDRLESQRTAAASERIRGAEQCRRTCRDGRERRARLQESATRESLLEEIVEWSRVGCSADHGAIGLGAMGIAP